MSISIAHAQPQRSGSSRTSILSDAVICTALTLVALAVRIPELLTLPVFTDEWVEIGVSVAIARDGARPLTNYDAYYGALTNYLMAGWFLLSGITVAAPRVFTLIIAVAQIPPAYLLARELARGVGWSVERTRLIASLSALLLVTAGGHIILNSHLAWSNSTTPLFTTTALWLLTRAHRRWKADRTGGTELALAALFLGLALQTHVLVIAFIVAAGITVLVEMPGILLRPWSLASVAMFCFGYVNMIAFNLISGGETIRRAQGMSTGYAGGKEISYIEKLSDLALSTYRLIGGAVDRRQTDLAFFTDPILILAALLSIAGLTWLAARGQRGPLITLLTVGLILPLVNNRYEPLLSGRYLTPLLPVCFVGVSVIIVLLTARFPRALPRALSVALIMGILCGYSLLQLHTLYDRLSSSGRSNARVLSALEQVQSSLRPGETVYLDNRLSRRLLMEAGAGDLQKVFEGLFSTIGIPAQVVVLESGAPPAGPGIIVLASRENARASRTLVERLGLTGINGGAPSLMGDEGIFEVYRLGSPGSRSS
jgi:hypothetical protein